MIEKKKKYKLTDFRYQLPKKYIAQKPKPKRDSAKMRYSINLDYNYLSSFEGVQEHNIIAGANLNKFVSKEEIGADICEHNVIHETVDRRHENVCEEIVRNVGESLHHRRTHIAQM